MPQREGPAGGRASRRGRPRQAGGARGPAERERSNRSSVHPAPLLAGEKRLFYCRACDHEADVVLREGELKANIGSCNRVRCPSGNECLALIAKQLGCRPKDLLDPKTVLGCLEPWLRNSVRVAGRMPGRLPSEGEIADWREALHKRTAALWYLTEQRGLLPEALERYELGWNGQEITLPIREADGTLVNVRRRVLGPGGTFKGLAGRSSQLFPLSALVQARSYVGVCEGEFDALVLNQHGFPAVTSTAGAGHWKPEWTPLLAGRCVAVTYDVDAEDKAEQRAAEFVEAGLDAFPARLSLAGFRDHDDVSDVLVRDGWTITQFRQFVGKCWRNRRAA